MQNIANVQFQRHSDVPGSIYKKAATQRSNLLDYYRSELRALYGLA